MMSPLWDAYWGLIEIQTKGATPHFGGAPLLETIPRIFVYSGKMFGPKNVIDSSWRYAKVVPKKDATPPTHDTLMSLGSLTVAIQ